MKKKEKAKPEKRADVYSDFEVVASDFQIGVLKQEKTVTVRD